MPPSQRISIYAELLTIRRQISVGCTLPSPASSATSASVSADGRTLTVIHNGSSETIQLPKVVASYIQLPVKTLGSTSLEWSLPLAVASAERMPPLSDDTVPWSALDLEPGSAVTCRTCQATVVDAGTLEVWRDLPSENWAEMFEFWHCHKPHDHTKSKDEEHLTNRGYGASSRITGQSGIGFVDLTSFLLAKSDLVNPSKVTRASFLLFSGLATDTHTLDGLFSTSAMVLGLLDPRSKDSGTDSSVPGRWPPSFTKNFLGCGSLGIIRQISPSIDVRNSDNETREMIALHCASCKTQLGVQNNDISSVSIFKWQVIVQRQNRSIPESYPSLAQCVSAMLLATMARSLCSKTILLPTKTVDDSKSKDGDQPPNILHIWVFNAITYSSTEAPASPINATKVFYRTVSQKEADVMVDSMTSGVEDIYLPSEAIAKITDVLHESNSRLPASNRRFKEWHIGLLEKWTAEEG